METREFLEKYRVKSSPLTYHLYKDGRDDLERFVYEKSRKERVKMMKRFYELGVFGWTDLTPRMQKVLYARFVEGLSLEEAGQEFGVTRERIRQMETKALEYLKNPVPVKYIDGEIPRKV